MSSKQKLELTWIGKEKRPRLEPRILVEVPEKSYHAKEKKSENDQFENMLIHGDNLLALKALEQNFTGKIKCIYIDPPYNTGSAFTHYDDCLEHSIWLGLMRERLQLLQNLLADDGSIWISIDADESHYLKVLCDEIFGRNNFIDEVIWQRSYSPINLKKTLSRCHDTILVYAKNKSDKFSLNRLPRTDEANSRYKNPDNDPRGPWKAGDLSVGPAVEANIYPITTPSGRVCYPPEGYSWRLSQERLTEFIADNRIWFGPAGANVPAIKRFKSEVKDGVVAMTIWPYTEVGHNQDAKKEIKALNFNSIFDTPKPEKLIERIITIATNSGDLVLDSFLGSGTTAAVAHKMGRRWIGIELGDHCYTHCIPRLQKVIDGTDQGGITKTVDWQGGGGFRFFELGESLIQKDKWGQEIINKNFNAEMLAQALCKIEGFIYAPSKEEFFIHGHSTENDFIYVTTNFMTAEYLKSISEQLGEKRSLLICCKGFESSAEFTNLTVKKIPKAVLDKCEWGHDDYSLNVANLPMSASVPVQAELFDDIAGDEK